MYNEVGLSVGKITRYTAGYDPRSMNIHEDGTDENDQKWRDRVKKKYNRFNRDGTNQ